MKTKYNKYNQVVVAAAESSPKWLEEQQKRGEDRDEEVDGIAPRKSGGSIARSEMESKNLVCTIVIDGRKQEVGVEGGR